MPTTNELRKAAAEALAWATAQEGVREAEVFLADNGQLFARLNFTSHIPSNGVEEPKSIDSFGIGIQAVFEDGDGVKLGFGSEAGAIDLDAAAEALAKARQGAVQDTDFHGLPEPVGGRRTLRRYHDPAIMRLRDTDLVEAGWTVVDGALAEFESSEQLAAAAQGMDLRAMGLILGGDVTVLQERIAIASSRMPQVQTDESTLLMSFATAMVEREEAKGNGWSASATLKGFSGHAGEEAAANAIRSIGGIRLPSGAYNVVFGPQAVSDLVNHLIAPSLNLGTFRAYSSAFQGKLGQMIASETLSITDEGATAGLAGSKGITCEGLPTGRTELIRDGQLVGLLANNYEYRRALAVPDQAKDELGADPREWQAGLLPRNGFRFATGGGRRFDSQPGIAATNIVIEGRDPLAHGDLLAKVRDGVYVGRIWYTYPVNGLRAGDFTCTVVADAFRIADGRLAEPVRANSLRISDNLGRLLTSVLAVGATPRPTVVWAADEMIYAPELAVSGVAMSEIGTFLAGGG